MEDATPPHQHLVWGGPGAGGNMWEATTSWQMSAFLDHLAAKKAATGRYGCDYIQWHNKGALGSPPAGSPSHQHTGTCNTLVDLNSTQVISRRWPGIAAALPMGNEEADAMGGWNHIEAWHADAGDAAAIVRILAMHEDMIQLSNGSWALSNLTWGYHANDNAFLNYGDAWFEQRTLVTRFEMNLTGTVEIIRKPTVNTMAILSLLGDRRHPVVWTGAGLPAPQPSTPSSAPFGAIATSQFGGASLSGAGDEHEDELAILMWNSNGTWGCTSACNLTVSVTLPAAAAWRRTRRSWDGTGAVGGAVAVRMYRLDQVHGNPAALFMQQTAGDPKAHPYPTADEFAALRRASELPSESCTVGRPSAVAVTAEGGCVMQALPSGDSVISVHLPQPAVVLVHACSRHPPAHGGQPRNATSSSPPSGLTLRTTSTPAQMFVRWTDVPSRCIRTYTLMYAPSASAPYSPVNDATDTVFTAAVHQQSPPSARGFAKGCYRVGWVDYWGSASALSASVCVQGAGLPRPFVNL